MLEALALLVAFYGLTILIPSIGKYRNMRKINQNCQSVPGSVVTAGATRNMLAGPMAGIANRTLIRYRPPDAKEPYEIFMRDHNLLMTKDYWQGDLVEVVYDVDAPYLAYPKSEWAHTLKDFRGAAICFLISLALFVLAWYVRTYL